MSDRSISADDDIAWAERCEYWTNEPTEPKKRGRRPRQIHRLLVIAGHGISLNIHQGTLLIRSGFTHYPQDRQEFRYFPGDRELPSRIIIVDGTGSITLDVLAWLSEQNVPLIRIDWRGNVTTVVSNNYGPDPKCVRAQLAAQAKNRTIKIAISLISTKFKNSIETLKILPKSEKQVRAIISQKHEIELLEKNPPKTINGLLGIEGRAAFAYFLGWQNVPLHWKGIGKRPIPKTWHEIGPRTSENGNFGRSRNASHPLNAILNYAYAILESHVRMEIAVRGYDPTIGYLHSHQENRAALVFDLMEPLRPIVDRRVIEFVLSRSFERADFTIRSDGVCRLNPEMAAHIVRITSGLIATAQSSPCEIGRLIK